MDNANRLYVTILYYREGYPMIPVEKIKSLVAQHAKLEDPATDVIWIRQDDPEAWLVEVIPSMADDDRAEEATHFNAGIGFRYPLAIIAGNRRSIEAALRRDEELAEDVAKGRIMLDKGDAQAIQEMARKKSRRLSKAA
jgi:hypothetical protein